MIILMNPGLAEIAKQIMTPDKGILASDERVSSANDSLQKAGVEPTEENRRKYRELFMNTNKKKKYLSGIILFEETLNQNDSYGKPFRETLLEKGLLIGIKVDEGTEKMSETSQELLTKGLDNLEDRLKSYYKLGARFTKWRSVIKIGDKIPTMECIDKNSDITAQYALLSQKNGLVPIPEPEVLMKGFHTISMCEEVMKETLKSVFAHLKRNQVDLSSCILKTSMCLPGDSSGQVVSPKEVGESTARVLRSSVPNGLAGVVFLSGGQGPDEATSNLNAISKLEPFPWPLTFSFLRAVEGPALEVWRGKDENVEAARKVFVERLKDNVLADQGLYKE